MSQVMKRSADVKCLLVL